MLVQPLAGSHRPRLGAALVWAVGDALVALQELHAHVRLGQVVAHRQSRLEQEPRAPGLGHRHPRDLDAHVPRARQDVHARVRITGVREHLLVLLEPRFHGIPPQRNRPAQLLDRRFRVAHSRRARLAPAGRDRECLAVAPARRVIDRAVGAQQLAAHVGGGEVVRRVVRGLPHQQRADRVRHQLPSKVGANALGAALDANRAARAHALGGAHRV